MNSNTRNVFRVLSALGFLMMVSVPVCATDFTATFGTGQTFIPNSALLGGIAGCAFGNPAVARSYTTQILITGTAGSYTFTGTGRSPGTLDPFLALYVGTFDPLNPTVNLVGCNDDVNPGVNQLPRFTSDLDAGTTYTVVTTIYGGGTVASGSWVTFTVTPDITLVAGPSAGASGAPALGTPGLIGLGCLLLLAGYGTLKHREARHF